MCTGLRARGPPSPQQVLAQSAVQLWSPTVCYANGWVSLQLDALVLPLHGDQTGYVGQAEPSALCPQMASFDRDGNP